MSEKLQWYLELQDRLSDPASRIERQLGRVRAQLKGLDVDAKTKALDKITDETKHHRAELTLQRDKLLQSKMALDKHGSSSRNAGKDAGRFATRLHEIVHIGQIAYGALEKMGLGVSALGSRLTNAITFKEGSLIGLKTFLGAGAGGLFNQMTDLAARTGRTSEELVGMAGALAKAGVAGKDLVPIITRLAGLNAISAGSGDAVGRVLAGMSSSGKGTAGDIEALRGTAINPENIYKKLGGGNRIAGKALADAMSGTPLGIVDEQGKNPLRDLILGEADKLGAGKKALEGGTTLEGRMLAVETQGNRMFDRLSKSAGVRAFKDVLTNLSDLLNPDSVSGKGTLKRLNELSEVMAKALGPLTGPEGKKRMEDFFASMTKILGWVIPLLAQAARYVEIVTLFLGGKRDAGAPKTLSEEWAQAKEYFGFGADGSALGPSQFGTPYEEFKKPVFSQEPRIVTLAPVVNVHVDARGAGRDDADKIADIAARKATQAMSDELIRIATQAGAFTP